MLNKKEMEVLFQINKDNKESKNTKLDQTKASILSELINKYHTKIFDIGSIIIKSDFTLNGGHIDFYILEKINKEDSKILDFNKDNYKTLCCREAGLLIEPFNYPNIEPYNRQSPYYSGCSYSNMDKESYAEFNLYKINTCQTHTTMRLDNFSYNNYHFSIRFSMCLTKDNVQNFISEFLTICDMNKMNCSILEYLNNFINN